jgi:hypothetical protein
MIAIVTGALLLALASSSFPLFVSAAESSSLSEAVAGTSSYGAGAEVQQDSLLTPAPRESHAGSVPFEQRDRALQERLAGVPHLGPRVFTILGPVVSAQSPDLKDRFLPVRLLAKTDWESHVTKVSDAGGQGVWIADTIASTLGLKAGDNLDLTLGNHSVPTRIIGTYEALAKQPVPEPYWLSSYAEIYPSSSGGGDPAPFVMMDNSQLARVSHALANNHVRFTWEFPLADESITLPQAKALEAELARFQKSFANVRSKFGRQFACFTCRNGTGDYYSLLSTVIATASKNVAAIRGPVNLLSVAGILVALTVIGSAGVFTMARRRTESALLFARGTGAFAVGAKAALESVLPVVLGTVLGFAAAAGLVVLAGPSSSIDRTAIVDGVKLAALGIPVAILLLGFVASVSYLRQSESATARFRRFAQLPWEIVVLALAGFFLRKVLAGGALVDDGGDSVAHPSVYLLLFPIFFIGGCGGLAARFMQAPLRRLVRRSKDSRPAPYLALHRLAGTKRLAVLLVTASALSLGILVYAQTVVTSLTTTIDAKSTLFVGSDVQATVSFTQEPPKGFPYPLTKVTTLPLRAILQPSGVKADVLVVNSKTLAGAAFWSDTFASKPIDQIAKELGTPGAQMPVVLTGPSAEGTTSLKLDQISTPVSAVAVSKYFPGASLRAPAVIVDRRVLQPYIDSAGPPNPLLELGNSTAFWIKGPAAKIVPALATSGIRDAGTFSAEDVRNNPRITAVTRTFGYLKFLGFGAGLLAIVAVLMYLQARQRNRVVSYALSRRMGLTDQSHRLSLILELLGMLVSSLAVAVVFALIAARLIFPEIDPLPQTPPGPLFEIPWTLILSTLGALIVVSIAGGALANRSAERADFAEVMRLAA